MLPRIPPHPNRENMIDKSRAGSGHARNRLHSSFYALRASQDTTGFAVSRVRGPARLNRFENPQGLAPARRARTGWTCHDPFLRFPRHRLVPPLRRKHATLRSDHGFVSEMGVRGRRPRLQGSIVFENGACSRSRRGRGGLRRGSFQENLEDGNIGRAHAADPQRLPEGGRADRRELVRALLF